jgi:hypothetical protein
MKASDIFYKTTKGQAEIDARSKNLSMKQRRVLILVNGSNDCSELKRLSLCDDDDIVQILETLIQGEFIDDGRSTTSATAAQDYAGEESPKEVVDLEAAEFMCNTLLTFANRVRVGKLIEEIRAAEDSGALKEMVKPWYMAIAETPGGMYQADDLRAEVLKMIDSAGFD